MHFLQSGVEMDKEALSIMDMMANLWFIQISTMLDSPHHRIDVMDCLFVCFVCLLSLRDRCLNGTLVGICRVTRTRVE